MVCSFKFEKLLDFMKNGTVYGCLHTAAPDEKLVVTQFALQKVFGLSIYKSHWGKLLCVLLQTSADDSVSGCRSRRENQRTKEKPHLERCHEIVSLLG